MRSHVFIAAVFLACAASAAAAQTASPGAGARPTAGWSVGLGAGAITSPSYRGSSTYRVRPIPAITARHGDDFSFSGLEADYTPFRAGPWSAGAQGRFRFGQRERDNINALRGLGGVGASFELGGFLRYGSGPVSIKASLAQDVLSGHEGQVGGVSVAYSKTIRRTPAGPVLFSAGPSLNWASAKFNGAYYGVDAVQARRSGLAPYRPGSGLESAGLSATLIAPVGRRVNVVAIAGLDRLIGDAADSPRIRVRGTPTQMTLGAFMTYRIF